MRKAVFSILCLFVVVMLSGCDYIIPSTWNYRITVEVETPEGVKSGSAVRQVVALLQPQITPETHAVSYRVYGEAVVVDLGERGTLFGIIGSQDEVFDAFPKNFNSDVERLKYYRNLIPGKTGELPLNSIWFIRFENINDPQSIETVKAEKLPQYFGGDVHLKKITIEITEDPITYGKLSNVLTWFGDKRIGLKFADPRQTDQAKYLTSSSFSNGGK